MHQCPSCALDCDCPGNRERCEHLCLQLADEPVKLFDRDEELRRLTEKYLRPMVEEIVGIQDKKLLGIPLTDQECATLQRFNETFRWKGEK